MSDPQVQQATSMLAAAVVDFDLLAQQLEEERDRSEQIRERAKSLEQTHRKLASHLNRMHATPAERMQRDIVLPTGAFFQQARAEVEALRQSVPPYRYFQYNQLFDWQIRNLSSNAVLAYFLGTGKLLTKVQAEQVLGIEPTTPTSLSGEARPPSLMLSTEDYLHSLISVINELSRLAVTSVTLGDFATPLLLSRFVKDLHAGFQLLSLKNNDLRKRFDSIKYDLKKIEEVVYDITLRGLLKQGAGEGSAKGLSSEGSQEQDEQVWRLLSGSA